MVKWYIQVFLRNKGSLQVVWNPTQIIGLFPTCRIIWLLEFVALLMNFDVVMSWCQQISAITYEYIVTVIDRLLAKTKNLKEQLPPTQ